MISPNPPVIASTVPVAPSPVASPRYTHASSKEITGSTLNLMISRIATRIAIAECTISRSNSDLWHQCCDTTLLDAAEKRVAANALLHRLGAIRPDVVGARHTYELPRRHDKPYPRLKAGEVTPREWLLLEASA